jgi:ATP-dependent Clp protease ATP-binding subunit ClpA
LQLFDEGRATDARGRLVEARHALFILTSNLFSVGDLADPQDYEAHLAALRASLAGMLRPEFVNRLSEIILFRELAPADLAEIARLELSGLGERLAQQGVRLTVEEAVYAWLGQEAHDGLSGARGLQRLIARSIMQPLSARLVAGPAPAVEVRLVGHLPVVHLTPAPD